MRKTFKFSISIFAVFTLVLVILGWSMLRRGFSARDEPSKMEAVMARTMRSLATPSSAKKLPNPFPISPENLRNGMEHFADHCAMCHANNGNGDTMLGRNMYPKTPDLRQAQTQKLSDGEIYYIIQNGIRLTGMPAFGAAGSTDDAGSWHLVQFIRHLPSLTKEEEAEMKKLNPVSPMEMESEDGFLSGGEPQPMKHEAGKMKHDPKDGHKH